MNSFFDFFLYWPVLATFAYLAINIPHWLQLHISQKIMLLLLADILPILVLYIYQSLDISGETISILRLSSIFSFPMAVLLVGIMLHTLVFSNRIPNWFYILLPIPFILLAIYYYYNFMADPAAANYPSLVSVSSIIYNLTVLIGMLALIIYSIYTLQRSHIILSYYTADGEDTNYRPTFIRVLLAAISIVVIGTANLVSMLPLTGDAFYFVVCFTVAITAFLIYFYNLMFTDYDRPNYDYDFVVTTEERKQAILNVTPHFAAEVAMQDATDEAGTITQHAEAGTKPSTFVETETRKKTKAANIGSSAAEKEATQSKTEPNAATAHTRMIAQRLDETMTRQKLYLLHNLTLLDVARASSLESADISLYLSEVLHLTFSQYIHNMRIQREVLPRLEKNPTISVATLMNDSGFRNPTSFYNAFMRVVGISYPTYCARLVNKKRD